MPTAVLVAPPPVPVAAAATASHGALRVNREAVAATPSTPVAAAPPRFASPAAQRIQQSQRAADESHSMGLGILGALGGAGVGAAIMVAFTVMVGIRFPLIGTVTGALTGFGARTLFKGTDSSLGAVAAVIALIATGGTLYALFGPFGMLTSIVSIVISAVMAWRMAS